MQNTNFIFIANLPKSPIFYSAPTTPDLRIILKSK